MKTKITINITLVLLISWLVACGQTAQPKTTEPTVPAEEAKKRSVLPNVGESLGFVYQPNGKGWNYKDVSLDQADFQKWYDQNKNLFMVISGPRQIGKTTLAEQLIKKRTIQYHFVSTDAVPSSNQIWIKQQWDYARFALKNSGNESFLLIIDEIQKINNWSEFVKKE
ncbi:MAG: AAA family ATPase [Ignavibacteria bacterium]